jgi:N6-adenosine-specific RNA methylase IME4
MTVDIYQTAKKYKTIYIDPPWPEKGGGKIKRGADRHYDLMSLAEIEALPVANLADPAGCHLYLWTTNNFLEAALRLVKTWGFEYITTITWTKDRMGLGQYYRGITEHCIFAATPKRLPYKYKLEIDGSTKRAQGVTGFFEAKTIHSRKPAKMREMIEAVSYGPRIELFARQAFPGWDCWGNEAPNIHEEVPSIADDLDWLL